MECRRWSARGSRCAYLGFRRRGGGGQSGKLVVDEAVDEGGAKVVGDVMEEAVEECLRDIVVFIMAAQSTKEVQVRQL